jgi:DNA-binding response OmpR family regulator
MPPAPSGTAQPSSHPSRKRVLIVDDSKTMVEVLKVYLMGNDFEFRVAATGEEAVELMQGWLPHLVVSDVKMPGMDGITLCSQIKSSCAARVIIVSSTLDDQTRVRALGAGADGVLKKPLDPTRLAYMANALLQG